jgi:hypothetical protein
MKTPRGYWLAALLVAIGVCLSACNSTRLSTIPDPLVPCYGYPEGSQPKVFVLYHPYGSYFKRTVPEVMPIPDYKEGCWNDERMIRDLERLSSAGLDGVICVVDIKDVEDKEKQERWSRFVKLALLSSSRLQVVFMLDRSGNYSVGQASVFFRFLFETGTAEEPNYLTLPDVAGSRNKPVVIVGPHLQIGERRPGISLLRTSGENPVWCLTPSTNPLEPVAAGHDGRQVIIPAAIYDAAAKVWILPQDKGETLGNGLKAALAKHPEYIILSSWNNFEVGDFIEPSTLDGGRTMLRLTRELATVKEEFKRRDLQKNAPPPAQK